MAHLGSAPPSGAALGFHTASDSICLGALCEVTPSPSQLPLLRCALRHCPRLRGAEHQAPPRNSRSRPWRWTIRYGSGTASGRCAERVSSLNPQGTKLSVHWVAEPIQPSANDPSASTLKRTSRATFGASDFISSIRATISSGTGSATRPDSRKSHSGRRYSGASSVDPHPPQYS